MADPTRRYGGASVSGEVDEDGTTTTTTTPPSTDSEGTSSSQDITEEISAMDLPPELVAALLAGQEVNEGPDVRRSQGESMITGEASFARAKPTVTPETGMFSPGDSGLEQFANRDTEFTKQRRPQYTTGDPMRFLNSMNTAELAALELRLNTAGFISDDNIEGTGFRSGFLIQAFSQLVLEADYNREEWATYLDYRVANPPAEDEAPTEAGFPGDVYLAPDYATLAQSAKGFMRQKLGRNASSAEMELLTNFMSSADRKQWQSNQYEPLRAGFEASSRASEGEDQGVTEMQGYDANARFNEFFDNKYSAELEHRQRVDDTKERSQNLFASIDELSRTA